MAVLLIALPVVCWAWIIVMARDMYGSMSGASRWMMTPSWDAPHLFLLWAMWAVMMTGMMLPSASPAILMFGLAARRRHGRQAAGLIYALAAGYLAMWALFSVLATVVTARARRTAPHLPDDGDDQAATGATLLILAGVYQLTPLKEACLRACQSPFGIFVAAMARWLARRVSNGDGARTLLHRVLLGIDAAAVRRRRDEPGGHRRAHRVCRGGEDAAPWTAGRPHQRDRSRGLRIVDVDAIIGVRRSRRHGDAFMEGQRPVLRNVQLRVRVPLHPPADGSCPEQRVSARSPWHSRSTGAAMARSHSTASVSSFSARRRKR